MMSKTVTERKAQVLLAGALVLLSQGAWSEDAHAAKQESTVVTVKVPNQRIEIAEPQIESNARETIDALNRRLAEDLEKSLEAIGTSRIELVISEVPTRG